MAPKLTKEERETKLQEALKRGWTMVEGRDAIKKTYDFGDFSKAFSWMTRVALMSEKHDHHPEWSNVYNKVDVTWSTHTCGGLSMNDITLAQFCDNAATNIKGAPST